MLMDLLSPDIFSMKGQVLHHEWAHMKVPDWSVVWNEFLTKKLPIFLSCLNEISEGCEKIVPVSELFWRNLKFFSNDRFNCVVVRANCEWMECDNCFPSQPLVVLTVDQFVGHDGGPLEQQNQDSHVYKKLAFCLWFLCPQLKLWC